MPKIIKNEGSDRNRGMEVIYVCSPYRGDYIMNKLNARRYIKFVMACGHVPIAPHIWFEKFINDTIPEERSQGLAMAIRLVPRCDQLWVFGKRISEGMSKEIEIARISTRCRRIITNIKIEGPDAWDGRTL